MAEEDANIANDLQQTASEKDAASESLDTAESSSSGERQQKASITETYFSNGNRLLTLPGSSLVINDDTRRLLALFSDGRFLVVETHKFDGRVLSFEVLARKKRLNI